MYSNKNDLDILENENISPVIISKDNDFVEDNLDKENKFYFLKLSLCSFISLLCVELLFKTFAFTFLELSLVRITLFSLGTSLVIAYFASFFKEIVAKIFICSFNFLIALYSLIQLSFKNFMGNYMSFGMLGSGDVGRISNEFITFIKSIKPVYFTLFIPFIILILLFTLKKKYFIYNKSNLKTRLILAIIIILIYLIPIYSLNFSFLDEKLQIKTTKQLYYNPNLFDESLRSLGSSRFLVRDFINMFKNNTNELVDIVDIEDNEEVVVEIDYERKIDDTKWIEKIENEEDQVIKNLHEYYINKKITPKNEMTGMFKDKNLVMIMVEALDMSILDPDITPTLYRLTKEGWYFDNYYAPRYSCTTGESEFISLTSIIPSNSVCTPFTYVNNNYGNSIFNLFNKSGYTSTSYHGWSDNYYPRTDLHRNMGSTYYNADGLGINITKNGGAWTSDVETMQKAYEKFGNTDKFFSFVITVSMHFSYEFNDVTTRKNWNVVKDLDTSVEMKRYLAKAVEFDESLKYLLDKLEEDLTLDDTVIVIFGDHHPYNLDFNYLAQRSYVDRRAYLNEDLMPFIIYNKGMEAKVISKTSSTFDILPTLANLFDLDYDPRYYTGVDIFSDSEPVVIFSSGSWATDKAVYYSSTRKFEIKEEGIDEEYITSINNKINNLFTVSNNTLDRDYFKYIYDE